MNVDFPDMGGGIIQDLPAEQIKRNQWSDGNNARFVRAQVSKITGHTEIFGTASASGTIGSLAKGNAIWLHSIEDDNQQPWWVYCDTDKIYATDGATHYEITNSATSTASMTSFAASMDYGWNGGSFNGLMIINSHAQLPRYWAPAVTNQTIEITASGIFSACRVMRPYKTFLMAIGINEGSGFNDNVVLWPTPADVGGLPPSWDYADTTEDAGRVELDDGYGILLDGERLRNDFFVYAEHAIYRFSPVSTRDIFSIRRQFTEVGLLTRNCIATVRHRHVFFGDGDIYMHDGQSIDSIVTKKWKNWVFGQMGENWKRSYVVANYSNNEVWFCFPTSTSMFPNKALVWDFDDNTFSSRDLTPAAKGGSAFMAYGRIPTSGDDSFDGGAVLAFDDENDIAFNASSSEINVRDIVMSKYADASPVGVGTVDAIGPVAVQDFSASFQDTISVGDYIVNNTTGVTATCAVIFSQNLISVSVSDAWSISDTYTLLQVDPNSAFFEMDRGLKFDTDSFTFFVEKDALPLGRDGRFNQYDEYQITAIRPRVRSNIGGNLKIKIGMRDSIGDGNVWVDTAIFAMGVDDKVDVRATGTVCMIRFECDEDTDVELNGFGIDYDIVGSRPR